MDLKVVCQKNEANEKNAPGPFIHCRGKTPGTNRLISHGNPVVTKSTGRRHISGYCRTDTGRGRSLTNQSEDVVLVVGDYSTVRALLAYAVMSTPAETRYAAN